MENLVTSRIPIAGADFRQAFAGRRVLVTGNTGFKDAWLAIWLKQLGAEVVGYALAPRRTRCLQPPRSSGA